MAIQRSDSVAAVGTAAGGRPATRHSPCDHRCQAILQSLCKCVVIWRVVIAQRRKAHAVGIATVVSSFFPAAAGTDGAGTAFVNMAGGIHEKVIADITP